MVLTPIVIYIGFRKNSLEFCRVYMAIGIIFLILPVVFFFGGGIRGGGIIWFSICYFYVGMILSGRLRIVMLTLLSATAVIEYYISFA